MMDPALLTVLALGLGVSEIAPLFISGLGLVWALLVMLGIIHTSSNTKRLADEQAKTNKLLEQLLSNRR